jgi:hypothetical protein
MEITEEEVGPNIFPMLLEMFPDREPRQASKEDLEKIKTLLVIGNVPIDINDPLQVITAIRLLEKIGLLSLTGKDNNLYIGNTYNGKE